jgi:hypothetical protein
MKTLRLLLEDGGLEDALSWLMLLIGIAGLYFMVYVLGG